MFGFLKRKKHRAHANTDTGEERIFKVVNMAGQFMSTQMMFVNLSGKESSLKKDHITVLSFAYGVLDSFGQAFGLSAEECAAGAPIMIAQALGIPGKELERANTLAGEMIRCSNPNYGKRAAVLAGGRAVHAYLTAKNSEEATQKTSMALAGILK